MNYTFYIATNVIKILLLVHCEKKRNMKGINNKVNTV